MAIIALLTRPEDAEGTNKDIIPAREISLIPIPPGIMLSTLIRTLKLKASIRAGKDIGMPKA